MVKFGIKGLAMLSGLALTTAFVAGCTEEAPPENKPAAGAVAPAKPGTDKLAPAPTAPKTDEKPK
jgi:hypothetical protein